ncbi:hypothetical protein FRC20_000929 [Serendipita sp. 405]|nr:hypothetical protein FRC20_000929 [Serendipita sp. 405]
MPFRATGIPTEVWEEIFEWLCIDRQLPSRRLGLVCRWWKETLLNLPTIWRTVEIDLFHFPSFDVLRDRLIRRLRHAKGLNVDVILSGTTNWAISMTPEEYWGLLRTVVELAPVERWRSLWITNGRVPDSMPMASGIFVGKFTSLRMFSLDQTFAYPRLTGHVHSELFQLLADSRPPLQYLCLTGSTVPPELEPLTLPKTLTSICVNVCLLNKRQCEQLAHYDNVETRRQFGIPGFGNSGKIILPGCVTMTRLFYGTLPRFDFNNVQTLNIDRIMGWIDPDLIVDLPNLQMLSLKPCYPWYLRMFHAPNVQKLKLGGVYDTGEGLKTSRNKIRIAIVSLFRDNRHLLTINPASLTIDLEGITDGMLVVMLEAWPQLKHLSMTLNSDFQCHWIFAHKLRKKSSPLCPQLETMYMEVLWHARSRKWRLWKEVARDMMLARRDGPLESILWKNWWFGVESVTRDDLLNANAAYDS